MAKAEGAPLIKKGNAEPFATVVDDSLLLNPSFDDVLQITDEEELLVTPLVVNPSSVTLTLPPTMVYLTRFCRRPVWREQRFPPLLVNPLLTTQTI